MKLIKYIAISILIIVTMNFVGISKTYAAGDTIDTIMNGADSFVNKGKEQYKIDDDQFATTSHVIYNLLLGIAMIVAVSVGVILGIQYVMGSVDKKADIKETLIGYVVSCIVVFGAFGIWKLVIYIF